MSEQSLTDRISWSQILKVAKSNKRSLWQANLIAIFAAVLSAPVPMLMPLLVDEVLLEKPGFLIAGMNALFPENWWGPAFYIVMIMFLTITLRLSAMMLAVWQTFKFTQIAKEITYQIRLKLLTKLQFVSMSEYEALGSGTVASHLVTDVEAIDNFIGSALSKFVVAALSIVGVAVILLWIHWQLALFILIMNPVVIYFTTVLGRKVKHLKRRENSAFELFQQSLSETLDGIHQIRAANRERHYIQRVVDKARGIKTHSSSFSWKSDAANRVSFFIFLMGFEVFRAVSMLMVIFSDLSIGQMFAVYAYLWFMMAPVQEILSMQYSYYSANAAIGRLNNLLDLNTEPQYKHVSNPFENNESTGLHVENLHFSYTQGEPILNGLSLDIKAGEKVAIVGASGGGKSTLVQILLGMYTPSEGQLYFGGVDVTEIGLDVVRENVATVLQHPALFNETVRNNISLGREYKDEDLWDALDVAQLRKTIEDLPDKLDTIVGRNGVRLSGGQRQRIAVARLVLSQPKIVILDEATSALDTETESKLHTAMHEFLKNRTTLIIAHRLSAVKQADRVYVFEDGQVIDEGIHEEMVQRDGVYKQLYGAHTE
ncbi:MAG: ABC transporter ATP-binding protein [endosymbiont of Galathealinum brachiosum]|uniref:ABC transporter ATP-binding protein n=1 Tax=endosymbiont of Galathealinum brachiosum TaxID=2200906 RepID=A0A370DHI6_9GAMM|nr:MAG: ABC transporter ATP-binding protein [endosymbiont of Galathealinum brachiosum]